MGIPPAGISASMQNFLCQQSNIVVILLFRIIQML
ncbi:MAG: hypothetical protein ACI9J0_004448, partial [Cryomorphaceae bacterium]